MGERNETVWVQAGDDCLFASAEADKKLVGKVTELWESRSGRARCNVCIAPHSL